MLISTILGVGLDGMKAADEAVSIKKIGTP